MAATVCSKWIELSDIIITTSKEQQIVYLGDKGLHGKETQISSTESFFQFSISLITKSCFLQRGCILKWMCDYQYAASHLIIISEIMSFEMVCNNSPELVWQLFKALKLVQEKACTKTNKETLQFISDFMSSDDMNMRVDRIRYNLIYQNDSSVQTQSNCRYRSYAKDTQIGIQDFIRVKKMAKRAVSTLMMARHKLSGSLVMLEQIPKETINQQKMKGQLSLSRSPSLEIRLHNCLKHHNILSMYGFFDDQEYIYFVLEYMGQETVFTRLTNETKLSEEESRIIIRQMLLAVKYLHERGIAHRDIKPSNILCLNNVYKLYNFARATYCEQQQYPSCYSSEYITPQAIGEKESNMSADLWSLGVLTFKLLTGKTPFYNFNKQKTRKMILNFENKSLAYPEFMSPRARDFIKRLIRKNPSERMKVSDALRHPLFEGMEDDPSL